MYGEIWSVEWTNITLNCYIFFLNGDFILMLL